MRAATFRTGYARVATSSAGPSPAGSGQPPRRVTLPSTATRRAGSSVVRQPGTRLGTHDDRGGRGGVGIDAGRGRDRRGPPRRHDRAAGARVDEVMERPVAASPAPDRRARRGDRTARDRDNLTGRVRRRLAVLGEQDPPAAPGRCAAHGDVAAERDQDAAAAIRAADRVERSAGRQIRCEALPRRTEIELDPGSDTDLAAGGGELDRAPARDRLETEPDRAARRRTRSKSAS